MRSTRRIDPRLWNAGLGALFVALVVAFLWNIPASPKTPVYRGAGNPTPRSGGTFVFFTRDALRSLDPHFAYDQLSLIGVRLLFDGLLDYDVNGRLVPGLAEALPEVSADGLRFTFHLRRGVRFHDGSELTTEDVRWSMHRMLAPATASPGAALYSSVVGAVDYTEGRAESVSGIRVVDRYTIEFTLTEPDQTFLNVMAMQFAYPMKRSVVERWGNRIGLHPVGTGPFRLEHWERGVEVRFSRHRGHFERLPRADRMVLLENLDMPLAAARFQRGDLDLLPWMAGAQHRFFSASRAWADSRFRTPDVMVAGLTFNCEMAPFDDVHVRRAIAYAINRPSRVRLLNGRIRAAGQPIPPQLDGYDDHLPSLQRYDLALARREMALAGHPNGLPEPIQVIVPEGDSGRLSVEMLQEELWPIGIRVEGRGMSFAQYLEDTGHRGRTQASISAWSMDFPDASNFLDPLFHSRSIHDTNSENRSFYRNPDLDRLLDAARSERDPAKRRDMYHQANEIVAHDAPWAFIYNQMTLEVVQPYVHNYRPNPVWFADVRNVWLDLPRHRAPFAAIVARPFARRSR